MKIPNERHLSRDLRIHDLVPDFRLEDVWMLPDVTGSAADFDRAVELMLGLDPLHSSRGPAGFLWKARDVLGRWFDLGEVTEPATGLPPNSLRDRLPADLQGTVEGVTYDHLPFVPLYRTETEYAAEVANATVHGVLHLSWVTDDGENYQGRMAVYVKPNGWFGKGYMAFIKPFRYLVVYPAMERHIAAEWRARGETARR